ncbi:MAG TPA: phosphate ABC transporter substrate-binding protein PstS [Acidimicrobiales bacterium]|nr:phosphate ABC transporter substrate-binding protein PstS [Acidimicrobiales bacterium]
MSTRPRTRLLAPLAALAAVAVALAACSSSPSSSNRSTTTSTTSAAASLSSLENWPTSSVSLQETGSSLLYPLFQLWAQKIQQEWPSVSLTAASTGSGTGVSSAAAGTVNVGASDAYLSPAQMQQYSTLENIPLAISAQQINYNIPGLTQHLKLDGPTISAIYQGQVTNWNDAKIAALNPGVTLPNLPIVTVHRSDSSGDTFLFTSFLAAADPTGWGQKVPPGTTVQWPSAPGAVAAQGNGGMVQACQHSPGCIAYIGVSYLNQATAAGLGYAALKNKSNNFELPSQAAISSAAASFTNQTPSNGAVSMIFGPASDGYPIVNYEYAIVPTKQPSALAAQAVKAVLAWSIDPSGGNAPSFLDQVNFVALPASVVTISSKLIAKVAS